MRKFVSLTALALALSTGVASAGGVSAGLNQIAAYLGVDAGAYSANELHQLLAARNAGDQSTYAYLLNHGDANASETVDAGKVQLAAQVGLNPADYTIAELTRVQHAQRRGDLQTVDFIVSHQNRNSFNFPQAALGRDS